ncbi:MAG: ATP-dependent helicase, partial [Desulfurococcales archaeon]|nr:ATP-dependent helicase [Desulfurococcales archaeon]
KAYGIIDSESGNYVVNGFISKNSSTSLELGIDIGYIDAVVLLSSPKSVTRLIQRVGRSGHNVHDTSKGYLIVVDRDDLVECTVLAKLAMERKLDKVRIPKKPLDILAQHIVGMSLEKKWKVEDAYRVVRRSYNYKDLSFSEFLNVLRYLAGRFSQDLESVNVYSKIWFDELEGTFGRKRSARMIYFLNSGAIPDEAKVHVFLENGRYVGDLEEAFVEYLEPGDVFVLGGRTYEFVRSDGYKVIVRRVEHQRPTVPSWFSEMLPLSFDSALEVGRFRRKVYELIRRKGAEEAVSTLIKEYGLEPHSARYIVEYISEQARFTNGLIPSDKLILIEVWRDYESRTVNIIFHTLFGRRANDALSRAYAYVLGRLTSYTVRVTVTDNGFMLTLPLSIRVDQDIISKLMSMVRSSNLRVILRQALRRSEILKRRFRHCAERAFAILRRYRGVETSISRRQVNSETLLRIAEKLDNFPILEEAYREVMEDYMNVDDAEKVLKWIEEGVVEVKVFEAPGIPSPFSHNIVAHGYSDIVLMEDRRKLLLRLYEAVLSRMR